MAKRLHVKHQQRRKDLAIANQMGHLRWPHKVAIERSLKALRKKGCRPS